MLDLEQDESNLKKVCSSLKKQFSSIQDELDSIIDNIPCGVLVLDSKSVIEKCNAAAFNILSVTVVGKIWHSCLEQDLVKYIRAPNIYVLRNNKTIKVTKKVLSNKKTLISIMDITEHVTANSMAKNKEKLVEIGEMMAKLSHQVKTPLSAAMLYAADLRDCDLEEEKHKKYSSKLYDRLDYLNLLVDDVLKYVKTEKTEFQLIGIDALVKNIVDNVKNLFKKEDKLIVSNKCKQKQIFGNLYQLSSIFINLLENSLQAGKDILVKLEILEHPNVIEFIVEDNAGGIKYENLDKVSKPFYTTKINGTGLGLSIVKSTVEQHKGKLIIKTKENSGTKIHILLPRGIS